MDAGRSGNTRPLHDRVQVYDRDHGSSFKKAPSPWPPTSQTGASRLVRFLSDACRPKGTTSRERSGIRAVPWFLADAIGPKGTTTSAHWALPGFPWFQMHGIGAFGTTEQDGSSAQQLPWFLCPAIDDKGTTELKARPNSHFRGSFVRSYRTKEPRKWIGSRPFGVNRDAVAWRGGCPSRARRPVARTASVHGSPRIPRRATQEARGTPTPPYRQALRP
jgi:hypothetical protein